MKHIIKVFLAAGVFAALTTGCDQQRTTYSDAEYVMFADTASVNMVLRDQEYFSVPIASTRACDYDRNFGVEIIDRNSNAIENVHYRLLSNTVTIPAGRLSAEVRVLADYDKFDSSDTLRFSLRLVMPEQLVWSLYGNTTRVQMVKSCPFSVEDFEGWCVVTSMFLNSFPGVENKSMQRLVRTDPHPDKANTLILRNWLFTGYDVELEFDPSDPAAPIVSMAPDQIFQRRAVGFRTDQRRRQDSGRQQSGTALLFQRLQPLRLVVDPGLRREPRRSVRYGRRLLQHPRMGERRGSRAAPARRRHVIRESAKCVLFNYSV